jgi:hypothetical protein
MGSETAVDSSASVFSFPQRTLVRLTVIGRIQRQYHPSIPPSWNLAGTAYPYLDADGERIGGDFGGNIFTDLQGTGRANLAAIGASPNAPSPGIRDSFSVTGIVRGAGPVRRRAFLQPSYPGPPACNGLTGIRCVIGSGGQQLVRIEIVSNGQLTLTATPAEVVSGDSVTFTASAGSLALQVHEWVWRSAGPEPPITLASGGTTSAVVAASPTRRVPNGGARASQTSAASCSAGQATCTIPVFGPGTMWVRATVGTGSSASVQAASADATAYEAVTCPTGDRLLDLPATRSLLQAIWDRTQAIVPKVEWAGTVYRLPDGSYRFDVDTAARTECAGAGLPRRSTMPGWTPVLVAHSHPEAPGDSLRGGLAAKGPHGGILSAPDWDTADPRWADPPPALPIVAIDPNTIAIGKTGEWSDKERLYDELGRIVANRRKPTKAQFDAAYSEYPRIIGSCSRP